MTDLNKQELRRLAERASPAYEWYAPCDLRYADDKTGEVHGLNHDDDSFISAANPAAILSLLDEVDSARSTSQYWKDEHLAANAEIERLRAEGEALRKGVELLPLFTCTGKGGEYAKLGYAKPAGAIKAIQGDSGLIVYRDTKTGQLYFRDPRDFEQRMMAMAIMEPSPLGGDEVRELTTLDISTGAGKSCGGLGCCQLCADEKAGEVGNG